MLLCDDVDANIVIVIVLGVRKPIDSAVEYCFCLWGPMLFLGSISINCMTKTIVLNLFLCVPQKKVG